jgi:uncharacterized protein YqgC (DUF456 family)
MTHWALYLLTLASMTIGLWITVLTLPGLWWMVASVAIFGWVTGWQYVGLPGIIALVVLATLAEVVEFVAGGAGAKKAGGSKRAFVGAIVGGILGGIFFTPMIPVPIVGTIIGICAGTFVGALAVELMVKQDTGQALRVGWGATVGRFVGIITKLGFGVVMFVVGAVVAWPTGGPSSTATTTSTSPAPTSTTVPTSLPATTRASDPNIR